MKQWTVAGLGFLASAILTPGLHAQLDAPAVVGVAAAPTKNLWSFFCLSPEQAARCKEKICNSPLGELLKNAAKPMTMMSGGLLFGKCGIPTADELAKLRAEGKLDGAEGTAALIKKSEAEARARREAMRYLGTVDCNYWPEAKAALRNGLRADPNECVRYEAALALLRGCCCNREIMEALKHSANGDDKDDFPKENSWRVREVAAEALARCVAVYAEVQEMKGPEKKSDGKEALPVPPLALRGKGLAGIFAAAAASPIPVTSSGTTVHVAKDKPAAPAPVVVAAPAPAPASAPAPMLQYQAVQHSTSKKGLLQLIGPGASPPAITMKEVNVQELIVPLAVPSPVVPVRYTPPMPVPDSRTVTSTVQPGRSSDQSVVPSRGIVIFDNNGAR